MKNKRINFPDFRLASNNSVTALYVVNPNILALDNKNQRGKPFLFYSGRAHSELPIRKVEEGYSNLKPYVGRDNELENILKGRSTGSYNHFLPEVVRINEEEVKSNTLHSGYVPFSFGVGHKQDVEESRKEGLIVRVDLEDFKRVLTAYDKKVKDRTDYEKTLGFKARNLIGLKTEDFGLQ